jgi:hypothetical protein
VSRSSAEDEYRAIANTVSKCSWLRHLLVDLLCKVPMATVAFCDNISSIYMSRNPVHHRRTKHIELDIHFVREKVTIGELHATHVPSARQLADVFTKGLPSALFFDFRDSLSVTSADVQTVSDEPSLQRLEVARVFSDRMPSAIRTLVAPMPPVDALHRGLARLPERSPRRSDPHCALAAL